MKRTKKPLPLSQLLERSDSQLGSTVRRAAERQTLLQNVLAHLPQAVKSHVHGANVSDDTLVLLTDSPVWGAKLHYLANQICADLSTARVADVTRLAVKVRPRG